MSTENGEVGAGDQAPALSALATVRERIGRYPDHLATQSEQLRAELERARAIAAAARQRVSELEADMVGRLRKRPADPASLAFERTRAADADRASSRLERELDELAAELPDRQAWEAERQPLRARGRELEVELDARAARHVRDALAHPGEHLTRTLGARPEPDAERRGWDDAAGAIERFRFLHGVDGLDALGGPPREPDALGAWRQARTAIERFQPERGRVDLER